MSYTLIKETISHDTIEALEGLLELARQGTVTGIAFVVTMKRRKYLANIAGEAYRDPTFTRGALGALEDELRGIIQGHAISSTTM